MPPKYTKSSLAIALSRLKTFKTPKISLEQYPLDSEIAGDLLLKAWHLGDIETKKVLDLGCGTGILAIGASLLGAKNIIAIEKDPEALKIAKINKSETSKGNNQNNNSNKPNNITFIHSDISQYTKKADTVLQNPPFGTKKAHTDRIFLEKAMQLAPVIYSLHKSETLAYIKTVVEKKGCQVTHKFDYDFPLKKTMKTHKRRIYRVKATFIRLKKI